MALNAIRLRRALSLSSPFLATHRILATTAANTTSNSLSSLLQNPLSSSSTTSSTSPSFSRRFFHSSHLSLSSSRSFNDVEKIDPDTILFEGCDYKHWLIVMDFGKDPQQRPSPSEMVETYVQTLAKVVGSVEEAKKRMYACSTTTYTGFQAEMDEETSQKFEGMPGVIFVLPDSFIDPVNKEYGGDKYINGTIIPRPPPIQYGRVKRHGPNEQRPMHNSMPGEGRGYMPQGSNQERKNTPGQAGRGYLMPNRTNYTEQGRDGHQGGGNSYTPPHQGGRNTYVPQQGGGNTYVPPQQGGGNTYVPPQQGGGNTYVPPQQGGGNTYVPPQQGGGNTYIPPQQGGGNTYVPPYQGNYDTHQRQMENFPSDRGTPIPREKNSIRPGEHFYNHPQEQMRNYPSNHGGNTSQGPMQYPNDGRNYTPPPPAAGPYGPGPSGTSAQGTSIRYDPEYASQAENQRFSQTPDEQNSMSTEHRNNTPAMQTGMDQRRC